MLLFSFAFELPFTSVKVATQRHCRSRQRLGFIRGSGGGAHGDRHIHLSLKWSGLFGEAGRLAPPHRTAFGFSLMQV